MYTNVAYIVCHHKNMMLSEFQTILMLNSKQNPLICD